MVKEYFDPLSLSVMSGVVKSIIRDMSNTVLKTSRSSILMNGHDFSCGIITYDHRLLSVDEAMPVHVTALELTTEPITKLFMDISEGDAYINNSPYHGGTHHADITVCIPVYFEGSPIFWTLVRSHHADIGAPEPTSYLPYAKTIYEEGLHLPCLRIQENYKDKDDLIRLISTKMRSPDIFIGDYRAQVGACRIGERRLKEFVSQYGIEHVKEFIESWINYGEKRAIIAIKDLPAGKYFYSTKHDPVPGVADDGIEISVSVTVDSEEGIITVDARNNIDIVEGGLNLSESCAIAACRIGVFYNLPDDIPHNHGSAKRIIPLLRDGCVVGRPIFPVGTSCATSNCMERLANAVQAAFSNMGAPYGLAEGGGNFSAGLGVVSGIDIRTEGLSNAYITQLVVGLSGGPALYGYDGWLTYESVAGNGVMHYDSVEINEAMYPIIFHERRVAINSGGAGEWCGAPAVRGSYSPIKSPMIVYYCNDGGLNPANGVLGGLPGQCSGNWKIIDNNRIKLPDFHSEKVNPTEKIEYLTCAGGGYGNPKNRKPELVCRDVNRGWYDAEFAFKVFGVSLFLNPITGFYDN